MRLLTVPDERLRQVAKSVVFGPDGPDFGRAYLQRLVVAMVDAMGQHQGIGLAAPQLGQAVRLITIAPDIAGRYGVRVLFNPVVTRTEGAPVLGLEGCLSVPGQTGPVARPPRVTVSYQDADGIAGVVEARGLYARVLQHEIDHLAGKLFTDLLPGAAG